MWPTKKIVYGRKWRVEPELPTSEIIQTIFLAIKKAREHEIREVFRVNYQGKTTTPFNNHHDLPLMSEHPELFTHKDISSAKQCNIENNSVYYVQKWLGYIVYDKASFLLGNIEQRKNGNWLIDITLVNSEKTTLPETKNAIISLQISSLSLNELFYQLFQMLISLSDRHVDEHFSYNNFTRFSYKNSILQIARISALTRDPNFVFDVAEKYGQLNNETDKLRVPILDNSPLAQKIENSIKQFGKLSGMVPIKAISNTI